MATPNVNRSFTCEVENSPADEQENKVTTVRCHGRLVAGDTDRIREVVKPLIPLGGRIVIDLGDLTYMDSAGLGSLLSLKVSAITHGYCKLELANMTPRSLELLRITKLESVFAS